MRIKSYIHCYLTQFPSFRQKLSIHNLNLLNLKFKKYTIQPLERKDFKAILCLELPRI